VSALKPIRAFLAGILGFGYVYVGRLGIAISLVGLTFALIAVLSWTRWILNPLALYVFAGLSLSLLVLVIVHPVVIAVKNPKAARKVYNRWWFYVSWLAFFGLFGNAFVENRATLLGYESYRILSASMAPTLAAGDFITVDSWRYRNESPRAGDVIVYEPEPTSDVKYIMRVVAVPGDEVELREGRFFLNREPAPEEYFDASLRVGGIDFGPTLLLEDEYFVLGDNRGKSRDSRYHGPVPIARISGRVESIWFSMADIGRFPAKVVGGT